MDSSKRINSLDYLRGVAILGMLIANVPWHTGTSMSRIQEVDGFSVAAWLLQYLIVDQRFLPIFCMLFGAGFLLLARDRPAGAAFPLYVVRRMGALFAIGLAHAYLIWPGDILLTYSICGFILLLVYRLPAGWLLALGLGLKAFDIIVMQTPGFYDATFHRLLVSWWLEIGDPPMSEAAAYAGSYADLFAYNAWRNQFIQIDAMFDYRIWNALGFMLIGMALFRWNILTGAAPGAVYRRLLIGSLLLGLPLLLYGLLGRIGAHAQVGPYLGWQAELAFAGRARSVGTMLTSFSMLFALLLVFRTAPHARLFAPVRAVGRMALTNYVMHSVIFLAVFAVFEWVPYDSLDPDDRLLWVVGIWALQLTISPLWLSRFRYGPLEGLWRRLSGPRPAVRCA